MNPESVSTLLLLVDGVSCRTRLEIDRSDLLLVLAGGRTGGEGLSAGRQYCILYVVDID